MTLTIAELDALPRGEAAETLRACCGSAAWVEAMLARRPFGSRGALIAAADETAAALSEQDWLEAFARHPRIGERTAARPTSRTAGEWSSDEQAAATAVDVTVQRRLAALNAEYAERFGFIFIICASGRSGEEILSALERRLPNDPHTELAIAAGEQRAITRLRLEKLLGLPNDDGERR